MCERGNSQSRHSGAHRPAANVPPLLASGLVCGAVALALILALAACTTTTVKRGQQFGESELAQIQRGMSQDQVRHVLGTPATTASVGTGNAYYYISSTMKESALTAPREIDRQVVAVYFAQSGTVDRVAHYGMKDGKVFDFVSRTTPSANTREEGLLKQIFRNLGQKQLFGD